MTVKALNHDRSQRHYTLGLYAGSFDPITRGHFDIVRQALDVFDVVEIAIGQNPSKTRLFFMDESADLITAAVAEEGIAPERVRVEQFTGSLMHHARTQNASSVIRGLRQISDFNDEFVLHGVLERTMAIPVVYFISRQEYLHVSSSTARQLASLSEEVDWLVHERVADALRQKYQT